MSTTTPTEVLFLVEEPPEGGFTARALGHSIFTEAENEEDLRSMVRDAVAAHFDAEERPQLIRLHFVRDEVLAVGDYPATSGQRN